MALQICGYFSDKSMVTKIFEGEMFIRTLLITLLQLFCKEVLYMQFLLINTAISKGTLNRLTKCTFVGPVTIVFWALKG